LTEAQGVLPNSADVVVIGGGVLGTSAAFHLAEAGRKNVLLLDRGPIAAGTTPFAAGQTGYLNTDRFALQFGAYCVEFFENFEQRTGYAIDFHQHGSLRIAITEPYRADLEARLEAAKEIGHEVEFISTARAKELVPLLELPADCGILLIPKDGYVEPKSVAVAFAAAARDRGVTIRTRCEVTGLAVADGCVQAVHTKERSIETNCVVLAAGAWTRQFGQKLGLNLKTVPVRHQAFDTAPLAGVSPTQPIVRITEPQIYVRPEAAGLLVGGYGYRPLSFDMNDFPDNFEIPALEADPVYYRQLTAAASRFFPSLRDAVVIRERRGLPTIAPDGRLIVSESEQVKGLIVTSACGVGGIHHSPGIGRMVAEIISGKQTWLPAAALSVDRFDEEYSADAHLRARCEEVYAHHYHETY
jgi:glycine/D-amino acid oxidase-like deaminating enzyme